MNTYLSTLPVFPGVYKFFIKSPGLTMQGFLDKMQGFLDVSRFWNSGVLLVCEWFLKFCSAPQITFLLKMVVKFYQVLVYLCSHISSQVLACSSFSKSSFCKGLISCKWSKQHEQA